MGELFSWWLVVEVLGAAGLPLAALLFARLPDRGWALAKPLALLVTGWLIWFPLSLVTSLPYNRIWILATFLFFALGNAALLYWRPDLRATLRGMLSRSRAYVIASEVVFAGGFALMAWERSFTPEIRNYEKFMDVGILSAIWRAPHLPPPDPWLSPFTINYYYFGHFLMATLAKLLDIQPAVAFNLAIPLIFALTAVAVFGVAANIVAAARRTAALARAIPFGLASVALVLLLGNLSGAQVWWQQAVTLTRAHPALLANPLAFWQHRELWLGYDWWSPSRVVPNTITEFPAFSFVLADLHAHVLALPFAALAVGLAFNLLHARGVGLRAFGGGRSGLLVLVVTAVCLGSLYAINSTDLPTYLGLALLALAIQQWLAHGRRLDSAFALDLFTAGGLLVASSFLLYLPFYRGFVSPSLGTAAVLPTDRTPIGYEVAMFGLPLFIAGSLLVVWVARWLRTTNGRGGTGGSTVIAREWMGVRLPATATLVIGGGFALLLLWTLATAANTGWTLFWCVMVVAVCATLALRRLGVVGGQSTDDAASDEADGAAIRAEVWALCLVGTAAALIAVCELVYVRDLFNSRMNTVFKLYYQAWLLLGIAGGPALAWLAASARASFAAALARPGLAIAPPAVAASAGADVVPALAGQARGHSLAGLTRVGVLASLRAGGTGERRAGPTGAAFGTFRLRLGWPDLPGTLRRLPAGGILLWTTALTVFVGATLIYPILATSVWTQNFSLPRGLDGSAYMASDDVNRPAACAAFQGTDHGDNQAIAWLNTHVQGEAVILEAPGCDWSYYSRVSAFTGLPTLVGWGAGGHEGWWRANWLPTHARGDIFGEREAAANQIYTSADRATVLGLLRQYDVGYVYVGAAERVRYNGANVKLFESLLHTVYNQNGVRIFVVPGGAS